jgi:hypothetical protein
MVLSSRAFYSDVVVACLGNDAAVLLGNDMLDNNFTKEQEDMYVQLQQMHEELTPKEKWARYMDVTGRAHPVRKLSTEEKVASKAAHKQV